MAHTAILIHGCHLYADKWHDIVFGTDGKKGRVPVALEEAWRKGAELVIWGTGASEKDGLKESQYTYNLAIGSMLDTTVEYINETHHPTITNADLSSYLQRVSYIDTSTQNTTQELLTAMQLCQVRGIQELILISSPTHIARCLQEACKIHLAHTELQYIRVYARASETSYANSTAKDVLIIEPPHRGDLPQIPFHKTLANIFLFQKHPMLSSSLNFIFNIIIKIYLFILIRGSR